MMKDYSSKVKVCLFRQSTESNYSIGDVLQVSAMYAKNVSEQHADDKLIKFQMRGKRWVDLNFFPQNCKKGVDGSVKQLINIWPKEFLKINLPHLPR